MVIGQELAKLFGVPWLAVTVPLTTHGEVDWVTATVPPTELTATVPETGTAVPAGSPE
jgi:hypothetical protein